MKACCDCKYFDEEKTLFPGGIRMGTNHWCSALADKMGWSNVITGQDGPHSINATIVRLSAWCGPEAKLWEPKNDSATLGSD